MTLDLGAALRSLRRAADLSQRELARSAGVPASTVARIESAEITNPRFRTIERLAHAAGGAVWMGRAGPLARAAPVLHECQADAAGRHYPAHLDTRQIYPFVGADRRILPPGTAVTTFHLNRTERDARRAREAAAAALVVEQVTTPGWSWVWQVCTSGGTLVGRLRARLLAREGQTPWPMPDAVLCDLHVERAWQGSGIERRLLAGLCAALAGHGPVELVALTHAGPQASYLEEHGFRAAVVNRSMVRIRLLPVDHGMVGPA